MRIKRQPWKQDLPNKKEKKTALKGAISKKIIKEED